ncbi:MAG TPA: hypothetical protein VKX25_21350 [Bryobacteraceae bacterium]|nr:hypothetical protein [Bryobacteraceae bacterium]
MGSARDGVRFDAGGQLEACHRFRVRLRSVRLSAQRSDVPPSRSCGGFDTRVKNEEAAFLLRTAKSLHLKTDDFSLILSPHGFWYCPATDHMIHQYPPGAGLILSLFHQDRRTQWALVLAMACIALPFLLIAAEHRLQPAEIFAFAIVLLSGEQLLVDTLGAQSVPLTLGLIPLAALGAWRTFSETPAIRWTSGIALGLISALLLLTRITNLFVVGGLIIFLLLRLWLADGNARRSMVGPVAAALALLLIFGAVPLLIFNRINAGHFLASTYAAADAAPPQFNWILIRQTAYYYFHESFAWRITFASILVTGCAFIVIRSARDRGQRRALAAAAFAMLLTLSVNLVYFLTHTIRIPYYLAPGCFFIVVFGVIAFTDRPFSEDSRDRKRLLRVAAALIVLAGCVEFELRHFHPEVIRPSAPAEVTDPHSIVWADMTSGTLLYYNGKYASKLIFAPACVQNRLIQAVYDAGRPQYFVVDSADVQNLVNRLNEDVEWKRVGTYEAFGSAPIYKIAALRKRLTCPG